MSNLEPSAPGESLAARRLGAPVELPWWVFPLALPPLLVVVLSLLLSAPLWARALAIISSLAMVAVLGRVAVRVASRNMQSVWISLALAVWFFCAFTWVAAALAKP